MSYADAYQCEKLVKSLQHNCCLHCKFFHKHEEATVEIIDIGDGPSSWVDMRGDCRRRSPVAMLIDDEEQAVFPSVSVKDWCGEFERSEERRGVDYVCVPFKQGS